MFFNITLFQKRINQFKKSRARFSSSQILLAEETKSRSLARLVFNLKAIEFVSDIFRLFSPSRHLKVIQLSKNMPKHYQYIFDKLSDKKNRLKIALQVSKLGFSPIVMPYSTSRRSSRTSLFLFLFLFVFQEESSSSTSKFYCTRRFDQEALASFGNVWEAWNSWMLRMKG